MVSFTSGVRPPPEEKTSPWGCAERYLNISRKPYQATSIEGHKYSVVRHETAPQSWCSIALKVVSYCTVIPALIFLCIKAYCRHHRVFKIGDETSTSEKMFEAAKGTLTGNTRLPDPLITISDLNKVGDETPASANTSEAAQTTLTAITAPSSAETPIVSTQINIVTETGGLPKPEVGDTPTRQGEEVPTPNALTAPLDKGANEQVSQNLQQPAKEQRQQALDAYRLVLAQNPFEMVPTANGVDEEFEACRQTAITQYLLASRAYRKALILEPTAAPPSQYASFPEFINTQAKALRQKNSDLAQFRGMLERDASASIPRDMPQYPELQGILEENFRQATNDLAAYQQSLVSGALPQPIPERYLSCRDFFQVYQKALRSYQCHNMPTDTSLIQLSKRLLNYERLTSSTEVCRSFHIDDSDFSVTISLVGETRCCIKIQNQAALELFTVEMDADARNQSFTEHGVQVAGLTEEHFALLHKIVETSLPNAFGTIVSFVRELSAKDQERPLLIPIRESAIPIDGLFQVRHFFLSYRAKTNSLWLVSTGPAIEVQLNQQYQPQSIIRSDTDQTIEDPVFTSLLEALEHRISLMMDPFINDLPFVDVKDSGEICVKTRQKSFERYPWIHLERLYTNVLDAKAAEPQLNIKFLDSEAVEGGGLSKTYLTTLFFELCKQLFESSAASLTHIWAPMTLPRQVEQQEEKRILTQKRYRQMGAIMMWCYRSLPGQRMLLLGNRFHPGLFNAVLSLTEEELTAQVLSPETKRKIREIVFQANADNQTPAFRYLQRLKNTSLTPEAVFDEFKEFRTQKNALEQRRSSLSPLEEERLKNLNNTIYAWKVWCEDYSLLQGDSFDPENSDDNVLRKQLSTIYQAIKSDDFSDGSLCSDMVSAFCACEGILGIAQGMRDLLDPGVQWDHFRRSVDYEDVSKKIQGSMARQDIAHFTVQDDPKNLLQEKARFLHDWIMDSEHTSNEEIRQFLLWLTGTDGITSDGIKLKLVPKISEEFEPFIAHTCFSQLEIAERFRWSEDADPIRKTWDWNTKEGFLAWLKDYSKKGAAAYTTK